MTEREMDHDRRADRRRKERYTNSRTFPEKADHGHRHDKISSGIFEKAAAGRTSNGASAPRKLRFGDCCAAWLRSKQGEVKQSSLARYRAIVSRHIIPAFGDRPVSSIDSAFLEEYKNALLIRKGLAPSTVKLILLVIRSVLRHVATLKGQADCDVAVHYPKAKNQQRRVLTALEQNRLVRKLLDRPDRRKLGILISLWLGLRLGEVCALRFKHISFSEGFLRVEGTLQRLPASAAAEKRKTLLVTSSPKSSSSLRTLPIPAKLLKAIKALRRGEPEDFLLSGGPRPLDPRALQRTLAACARGLGLEGLHFHSLRHTFATSCAEGGMEPKCLSEVLGHSNVNITFNYYVHSSMETKKRFLEKVIDRTL